MKSLKIFWTILLLLMVHATISWADNIESPQQRHRPLTVKVSDAAGPIIGANVIVKGTTNGNITNQDGVAILEEVAPNSTLVVSFIGYTTQEINISNNRVINVVLREDNQKLDEVVVIGYGTARKRDLTGSITSVKTQELQVEAPRSVQDLLRGNAAGVSISATNDAASNPGLQIRGDNTLKAGSSPLIVLDGVIYEGSITDINPYDIESIDVLKDASSASVYGAKASNGVLAITTKKGGKQGRPSVNFNTEIGFAKTSHMPDILDGKGFIKYRQDYETGKSTDAYLAKYPQMYTSPFELQGVSQIDWYNYDQKTPVTQVSDEDLTRLWLSRLDFHTPEIENYLAGKEEHWDKLLFHTALQQDYSVSVSNHTKDASYYWSVGYADRKGVAVGNRYTNLRTRLNLETTVADFLTIGLNTNFAVRDDGYLTCDYGQMTGETPYGTNNINDPESLYRRYPTSDVNVTNPFYDNLYRDRYSMYYTLNSSLFGKVKLPFGIEYQVNYTPYLQWHEYYNHESSKNEGWAGNGGNSTRENYKTYNWQIDNVFHWKSNFENKDHSLEATFLINSEKGQYWSTGAYAKQFSPNDVLGYHRIQAGTVPTVTSNDTYRTGDALMGRLFYSFKNRYMVTGTLRRDGYSAFGANNKRAWFPSVALGWVFSQEKFMSGVNNWLSYGKLRVSYGINGNRDIGQYEAISDMTSGLHPYIDQSGNVYTTSQIYINRMANNDLKWERTSALNFGLDFGLLNDMISGTVEGYLSKTNDLLVDRALPSITGFSSVAANLGQLQNWGIEATLSANLIKQENFTWNASGTFSMNRRKINKLYGDMVDVTDADGNVIGQKEADDEANGWFIGQDPNRIWAYKRIGVWQLGEEADAAKYGCQPGDFKYKDQNNDGVMNKQDKVFQGYTTPRFRWTFRSEFTFYKNFSLSTSLYSSFGQYGSFNTAAHNDHFPDRSSDYDLPRWTRDNPINNYARIGSLNLGTVYKKKSFIRMDNISLAYQVPSLFLKRFSIQGMRLSVTVRNAFIWSPTFNNWYDPEIGNYSPRIINFGVNFTL